MVPDPIIGIEDVSLFLLTNSIISSASADKNWPDDIDVEDDDECTVWGKIGDDTTTKLLFANRLLGESSAADNPLLNDDMSLKFMFFFIAWSKTI